MKNKPLTDREKLQEVERKIKFIKDTIYKPNYKPTFDELMTLLKLGNEINQTLEKHNKSNGKKPKKKGAIFITK